ncbi:MAG: VCBS domain-containing protein, partial [Desulfofustis sp.]|nr:VCBS domain-containing protein [Desulfofustis sp.]
MIVYGTVKAVSPDGVERIITPNSPIFFQDRINTGSDGAVSIVFTDPADTQLDLGRMTDMVIDQDVIGGSPIGFEEVTAEVEAIQQALEGGGEIDVAATAAGPGGGAGPHGGFDVDGRYIVKFAADAQEVNPTFGAETQGVEHGFVGTELTPALLSELVAVAAPVEPEPVPEPEPVSEPQPAGQQSEDISPAPPPPPPPPQPTNYYPNAQPDQDDIIEGTGEGPLTTSGNVIAAADPDPADPDFQGGQQADSFGGDGAGAPQVVAVNGDSANVTADGGVGGADAVAVLGAYGYLELDESGNYTYYLFGSNEAGGIDHDTDDDGDPDPVSDVFTYTIQDSNGDTSTTTLTINIADTGPTANNDFASVEEGQSITGDVVDGDTLGGVADDFGIDGKPGIFYPSNPPANAGAFYDPDSGMFVTSGTIQGTYGVLTVNNNSGGYTYLADSNLDQSQGQLLDVFTYQITDGDGSTGTATLTIDVTDGAGSSSQGTALVVDEAAITTSVNAPALSFTAGSDDLVSFAFSDDLTGLLVDINGQTPDDISWTRVDGTTIQ